MPDPFAEPEFQDRLRKLLRMLGSDQEQEADTARRKLLSHLAQHDLSANDLADRLAGPPSEEIEAARAAARHAEQHAARADARRHRAEVALAEATRGSAGKGRRLRIALAMLLVALPCAGIAALLLLDGTGPPSGPAPVPPPLASAPAPTALAREESSPPGVSMFTSGGIVREVRQPTEWLGAVLVAGTELRSDLRPDAIVLATLQAGERVTVQRSLVYQGMEWLQVSTGSGPGFVPVGRVRRIN